MMMISPCKLCTDIFEQQYQKTYIKTIHIWTIKDTWQMIILGWHMQQCLWYWP